MQTDAVHERDNIRPGATTPETLSEAVKLLKGEYVVRAIQQQNMDQGIIFCRTKVDCDNLESYLNQIGAGTRRSSFLHARVLLLRTLESTSTLPRMTNCIKWRWPDRGTRALCACLRP